MSIELLPPTDPPATRIERFGCALARLFDRFFLEAIVLGGFILMLGTLGFYEVPEGNKDLFGQGLVALTAIAMLAAKSRWERQGRPPGDGS